MKRRCQYSMLSLALLVAVGLPRPVHAQSVETIVQWNRILLATLVTPGAQPPTVFVTRPAAIMSVAVFDAVNSFDRLYLPYATQVNVPPGASRDAAAAQAAHDVLVALFPAQRATFDAALVVSLAGLPADGARDGALVGVVAAQATLALRANDGWNQPLPSYILPNLPGYWQPTPPANAPAAFTHYPYVQGFVVPDGRRFQMEGPPALTSTRYATDFNETKTIGSVNSATRTAEQTQMANLWAGVNTTTTATNVWNLVLGDLARTRNLSGLDAARGFALLNMTTHDALLTSFTGKFLYGLWRPVTAIREAGRDDNAATEADPTWLPLLTTPPYPGHPGNMACLGSSQAQTMTRLFGQDNVPFSVTWVVTNGPAVTRSYNGFRQLGDEEAKSRIWGGIHFQFESLASIGVCSQLGDYVVDNTLRRR
jgi:hypothetical protein